MLKKWLNTFLVIVSILLIGFLVFRFYPLLKIPFLFTTVLLLLHYYVWTAVKPRLKALKPYQQVFTIFVFSLPVILLFSGIIALFIQIFFTLPLFSRYSSNCLGFTLGYCLYNCFEMRRDL